MGEKRLPSPNVKSGLIFGSIREKVMKKIISLFVIGLVCFSTNSFCQESFTIGVAGPLSQKYGQSIINAVQLYFDQVNENGGIDGQKLMIERFDDQNDADIAKQHAEKIAQSDVLSVIGHWYSSASLAAGQVYLENQIPAISPGSTNINVTKNNEWYFRTIYNDTLTAAFSAKYVHDVFKAKKVSVVSDNQAFGKFLSDTFIKDAQQQGLNVVYQHTFDINNPQFDRIVQQMQQIDPGVIFLGMQGKEAAELLFKLRSAEIKNNIVGGSSLSGQSFMGQLTELTEKSNKRVNFFLQNTYVAAPLIYDTANYGAQIFKEKYFKTYKTESDWGAAYSYDAAKVIVAAIRRSGINASTDIKEARLRLRDTLSEMHSQVKAVKGITGLNYFNADGDAVKPVSMGIYKGAHLVSAMIQYQPVPNPSELYNIEEQIKKNQIVQVGDLYLYKTKVVNTGIMLHKVSNIDFKEGLYDLDFSLWFRYRGDFDVKEIEFQNSLSPIELDSPLKVERDGDTQYQLFKLKGRFKLETKPDLLGRYTYELSFKHKILARHKIILVPDEVGMGIDSVSEFINQLNERKVIAARYDRIIDQIAVYEKITFEPGLGALEHSAANVNYSNFSFSFRITKTGIGLMLDNKIYMLIAAVILTLFVSYLVGGPGYRLMYRFVKKTETRFDDDLLELMHYPVQIIIILIGFYFINETLEGLISKTMYDIFDKMIELGIVVTIFMGIVYRSSSMVKFYFEQMAENTESQLDDLFVPYISKIIKTISVILVLMKFAEIIFGLSATAFLGVLGGLSLAFGLLFKDIIAEVAACLMIFLDDLYHEGDTVRVGGGAKGVVEKIGLRTTRIRLFKGPIVKIANTKIVQEHVENYSRSELLMCNYKLKINGISSLELSSLVQSIRDILEQDENVRKDFGRLVNFQSLEGNKRVIAIVFRTEPDWEVNQYTLERVNYRILNLLEANNISKLDYQFVYMQALEAKAAN